MAAETAALLDTLIHLLMDAYTALPQQDQDGPLGERITQGLHEASLYLFAQDYHRDTALIKRLAHGEDGQSEPC